MGQKTVQARKWAEYIFDTYWFERVETIEVNSYMVLIGLIGLLILIVGSARALHWNVL